MASLKIAPPAPKKENIKDYQPSSTIAIPVSKVQLLQEVELLIKDDLAAFFSSEGAALELPAGEPYGSPLQPFRKAFPRPPILGVCCAPPKLWGIGGVFSRCGVPVCAPAQAGCKPMPTSLPVTIASQNPSLWYT